MTELNDHELLAEFARSGSEVAFATLTARHVNLVYSAALRFCGNAHHCEEITQAVFIILARKAGKLSPRVVLSGWLYQTARLTAANLVKGEIRRQRREQEAYMQSTLNETGAAAWQQLAPLLDEAMGRLGETDRNAVVLRFFENKTAAEVAAALKLTEAAAHKRVNRALEKLRKIFGKRGVALSATLIAGAVSASSVQAAPAGLAKSVTLVAMTKGVAASGSTLTLIKGALKIMAWTKMKTAIVVGAGLFGIGLTSTVIIAVLPAPDIQGMWIGTISLSGSGVQAGESPKTRLVLKIAKVNGMYQVSGDNLDRGVRDIQIANFTYKNSRVHIEIPNSPDSYDGTVNRAGTEMAGKWKENNDTGALTFKRTTNPPPFPEPLADADFVPRAGSALQGFWKGVIKTERDGFNERNGLEVNIKIAEDADGTFRADFYVPPQGNSRQPTSVSYDGTTVKLMPMAGYGMFQGTLTNGGKEMAGDWVQGGQRILTTFTRAN
jgi:RNA polymerase sigma factor (sigma-70 family)